MFSVQFNPMYLIHYIHFLLTIDFAAYHKVSWVCFYFNLVSKNFNFSQDIFDARATNKCVASSPNIMAFPSGWEIVCYPLLLISNLISRRSNKISLLYTYIILSFLRYVFHLHEAWMDYTLFLIVRICLISLWYNPQKISSFKC